MGYEVDDYTISVAGDNPEPAQTMAMEALAKMPDGFDSLSAAMDEAAEAAASFPSVVFVVDANHYDYESDTNGSNLIASQQRARYVDGVLASEEEGEWVRM